jgi:MFS transporter, MHS family, proline/betaine transporter
MMLWRTIPVYTIVYFMPSYLTRVTHLPAIVGFRSSALSALLLAILSPVSGMLADRLTRLKPLLLITSGLATLLVVPVFYVFTHAHDEGPVLIAIAAISIVIALGASAGTVLVLERLPSRVRASGVALSYALGVALFGGTAQFVVTALIKWTGDPMSITWYVAPACLVSFCAFAMFEEQRATT